ncbi:hypothetical protein [Gilvimarinus polysaccharolyticus]|uniref:hypothetical protein n=1 Tax=Gilvimarinus polysaccharolyticus TaxID=863921 RepID=UPI00067380C4|nr:hypothetical protein [Gilvimarinus polysaccharolyticus]
MEEINTEIKKSLAQKVGANLVSSHGKKKYYSQSDISKAVVTSGFDSAITCWALSLFMHHDRFDDYHSSIGEDCDYSSMKESMLSAVTEYDSESWFNFNIDLSWLELPDIDVGSVFDIFDF